MKSLLAWFARHRVAANLLMGTIIVGGLTGLLAIRFEVYVEYVPELISVSVIYPGASPTEVEEAICARIEERVQSLKHVRKVRSVASEGFGEVVAELLTGTDLARALEDVKAVVDTIDTFPDDTESPVVKTVDQPWRVLSVAISGDADHKNLALIAETVREEMLELRGITHVELVGIRPYEVAIEVSEKALRIYNLTLDQVARAIQRSSLDLPGGLVRSRSGQILIRTAGQASRSADFEPLSMFTTEDGTRITLSDVATVTDGFSEDAELIYFDGNPAVLVEIFRVGNQDVNEIATTIRKYINEARLRMPQGVQLSIWQDETIVLRSLLDILISNLSGGFILVLLALGLFLKPRLALWVASGVPLAFLGTMWTLSALGHSINLFSLQGFIMVLGILVDDAIIVGENILRHYEMNKAGLRAAVEGAQEVLAPVLLSVVTTIIAFVPLLMIPGSMGYLWSLMVAVIIITLTFSLIESLLILPSHLSDLHRHGRLIPAFVNRISDVSHNIFKRLVRRYYSPALAWALSWRYTTLAAFITILLISLSLVAAGRIPFSFVPLIDSDRVVISLKMPQGTPAETTLAALSRFETSLAEAREELDSIQSGIVRHVKVTVGRHPTRPPTLNQTFSMRGGSHLGEIAIELVSADDRQVTASQISDRLRELTGPIVDAAEIRYTTLFLGSSQPLEIEVSGHSSLAELHQASLALQTVLGTYPGIWSISDSMQSGKREIQLTITPEAEALGIRLSDIAKQVRQAFHGEEVQRIQRGRNDVGVVVRYPQDERRWLSSLERMPIRTAAGHEVPLSIAANIRITQGPTEIARTDGRRTVRVTAEVDPKTGSLSAILDDARVNIFPELETQHPGVSFAFSGEQEEQREAVEKVSRGTLLIFFVIYVLLAVQFDSYLQPLIVMSAIPFGVVGAIWGHLLIGEMLSFGSFLGVVALSGVVVNDSLVLIDFINRSRRSGSPVLEAVQQGGRHRLRPIVLTSLTTFVGLVPMVFETSIHAGVVIPVATSLAFGSLFATLVTLFLVPVTYSILEDLKSSWGLSFQKGRPRSS